MNGWTPGPRWALALLASPLLAACGESTGIEGPQNVTLAFRVAESSAAAAPSFGGAAAPNRVGGPMVLDGANGTLSIDEVLLIVNEVELKHADGSCDDSDSLSDDCPEFEAPPRLLDLPLDGTPVEATSGLIDTGIYKELDFEIEDLEDEGTAAEMAAIAAVRAEVLARIPDWPRKASAMIRGSFQPTGGAPQEFRVFLDAEIEIELELVPNLVVSDDGTLSRDLIVDVRPDLWFRTSGGLMDLTEWDYDETGQLLEFEVEMEEGFTKVELDD